MPPWRGALARPRQERRLAWCGRTRRPVMPGRPLSQLTPGKDGDGGFEGARGAPLPLQGAGAIQTRRPAVQLRDARHTAQFRGQRCGLVAPSLEECIHAAPYATCERRRNPSEGWVGGTQPAQRQPAFATVCCSLHSGTQPWPLSALCSSQPGEWYSRPASDSQNVPDPERIARAPGRTTRGMRMTTVVVGCAQAAPLNPFGVAGRGRA